MDEIKIITIEDVLKNFRGSLTSKREALIRSAYDFAKKAHQNQKRSSGEDYIQHPLHTALNLARIGVGSKTIAGGLLHDVPEDTSITLDEIEKKFGMEIASMINGITKLGKIKLRDSHKEYYLENLRKMFLAMAVDIRVVLIKLADRLHNMETLYARPVEKQKRIARETMEIFAPIANRLGIGEVKGKLEDLSFKYLEPENYDYTKNLEIKQYQEREQYVNLSMQELKKELDIAGIKTIDIHGRVKHLYRLFKKLERYNMDINQIYDLAAVRIIVPDIADCYETLGIVHKKYRPMIGRIKDYISLPKPNGYQSIHTTIFGPEGKILEVQIRTQKMHDEAEFGIAAHWIYSEKEKSIWNKYFSGGNLLAKKKNELPKKDLIWVKQLREWQKDIGRDDFEEFMEGLKIDFFKNHIFAFTPKGDIIDLPEEATPVDFAFAIHSEIGSRTIGAKVNNNIVPLNYHIKNGQVVEILTSKENKKPSQDWLRFVKTSVAKTHIRKQLNKK